MARPYGFVKYRELGLWQRRFWERQIRDEGDFMRHVDYMHFNPVKQAGMYNTWWIGRIRVFMRR